MRGCGMQDAKLRGCEDAKDLREERNARDMRERSGTQGRWGDEGRK